MKRWIAVFGVVAGCAVPPTADELADVEAEIEGSGLAGYRAIPDGARVPREAPPARVVVEEVSPAPVGPMPLLAVEPDDSTTPCGEGCFDVDACDFRVRAAGLPAIRSDGKVVTGLEIDNQMMTLGVAWESVVGTPMPAPVEVVPEIWNIDDCEGARRDIEATVAKVNATFARHDWRGLEKVIDDYYEEEDYDEVELPECADEECEAYERIPPFAIAEYRSGQIIVKIPGVRVLHRERRRLGVDDITGVYLDRVTGRAVLTTFVENEVCDIGPGQHSFTSTTLSAETIDQIDRHPRIEPEA